MKAITVHAPWWWFILHGGKGIENRDWASGYRGPLLIHAGKSFDEIDIQEALGAGEKIMRASGITTAVPTLSELRKACGHIVGRVEMSGCVSKSSSPWFFGKYGFVLRCPIAYETPIPCRGMPGIYQAKVPTLAEESKKGRMT